MLPTVTTGCGSLHGCARHRLSTGVRTFDPSTISLSTTVLDHTFFARRAIDRLVSDRTRAHVFVSGTVQGVYYRASTRDAARDRGVDGWVKNRDDGRVEAVFEGEESAVEAMVEWCHTGSDAASVERIEVEYDDPEGESGFEIRR